MVQFLAAMPGVPCEGKLESKICERSREDNPRNDSGMGGSGPGGFEEDVAHPRGLAAGLQGLEFRA